MTHARYLELLETPEHLRAHAQRWGKLASQAGDAAAATAYHRHIQSNAERAAATARDRPTPANLNVSATMAILVAKSAESLAQMLKRPQDLKALPPANVVSYLAPDGWHAEALVHDGGGLGKPILRVEGADSEDGARSDLRRLAEHPDVVEAASGADHQGTMIRAATRAAIEN